MIKVQSFDDISIYGLRESIESFINQHKINKTQIISINLSSTISGHCALLTYEE